MDKFHEIAADYFNEFEGRNLYPRLWNPWVLCMVLSVVLVGMSTYYTLVAKPESAFITVGPWLLSFWLHWQLRMKARENLKRKFGNDLDAARKTRLEELTGRQSSEFAALAREILDLSELRHAVMPRPFSAMRWIYRRDMSNQLVALAVSLVAVVIAISPKTFTLEPDDLFTLIESQGLWYLIWVTTFLLALLYIVWMMLAYLYGLASQWLPEFFAMWTTRPAYSTARLQYLIRDLVKYHTPDSNQRHFALQTSKPK